MLIFDTETTTDAGQALNFGCYRYCRILRDGGLSLIEEDLFYADDLPERDPDGFSVLQEYARAHGLRLHTRREFVDRVFFRTVYTARALVVGFNLPFDLSRLAVAWGEARGFFAGGVSLLLADYEDEAGDRRENRYRPRVAVKSIDSKRAFIGFTRPAQIDTADQIPEDSPDGVPDPAYTFRGHFLDLRTLVFALTDKSYSLTSACEAFGVVHGKMRIDRHGVIDREYIAYCRRDVEATAELYAKLMAEYVRHPIALSPTDARSPASIGKAYLDSMGVGPRLDLQPDFPSEMLGAAMVAYYGGRAECRVRRTPVPVVHVDFLSMYPTVNALVGMWRFVTAEKVTVEEATQETRTFVESLTVHDCFDPATWQALPVLVQVEPADEVLPVRAEYAEGLDWQIGCNPLASSRALWYSLADVIAAKLLTGRAPAIKHALRLNPTGRQKGLRSVRLRGEVDIDPGEQDFFRSTVEERQRVRARTDLPEDEKERLRRSLKVTANSTGYGIFAEINRRELGPRREPVYVYGLGPPFVQSVSAVEEPGIYSFPPLAACITGAARLMLALLERLVTDKGGTYAFCDTDALAIVANNQGGLIPCSHETTPTDGPLREIHALSLADVDEIITRFNALNPYDPTLVESILELEKWNYDEETDQRRQLYCFAISAKRYAFYNLARDGAPILRKVSEHGLGHLLNPTDLQSDDRGWIEHAWQWIISQALGRDVLEPPWLDLPALTGIRASSTATLRPFANYNAGRRAAEQVRPFNFLLSAHVSPFAHPNGRPPERFHLIAPFERDSRRWHDLEWIDLYSGDRFPITTTGDPSPDRVRVKTYRDVLAEHRVRPEPKSLAPDGTPCGRATFGLLGRRPVTAATITHIGKESNKLEEATDGLIHDPGERLTEYNDPSLEPWTTLIVPVLRSFSTREIATRAGLDRRTVQRLLGGHTTPHRRTRAALTVVASELAAEQLRSLDIEPPHGHAPCLAAHLAEQGSRPVNDPVCLVCGTALANPRARYCGETCKKRAYRARRAS